MKLTLLVITYCFFSSLTGSAQIISTVAGTRGSAGYSGDGSAATAAQLYHPYSIAVDDAGNLYIGDGINAVIRKVSTTGIITTIAGTGTRGYTGDGGPATAAQLYVGCITVDNAGNLYVAGQYEVRKINSAGIISTVAGNGTFGFSGDGGPATAAQLHPGDIAADHVGNLYISDYHNGRIRRVNSAGTISTFAGNGILESRNESGVATAVAIIPQGLAVDKAGNLYVADGNFLIRKITPAGMISTVAGDGIHGYGGDGGSALRARLDMPYDMAIDLAGNVYIADYNNQRVRKVTTAGVITTIGGTGVEGYTGDGGLATNARITYPTCIVVDKTGNVFISDPMNHTARKITGCVAADDPGVIISASGNAVCAGTEITFTATSIYGGNTPTYEWKINDKAVPATGAIFKSSSLANNDVVSCILTSSEACTLPVSSNTIAITIHPSPVVSFNAEIVVLPGQSATLSPVITGDIQQYQWSPPDGLSNTTIANPVVSPAKNATYELKVVSTDGCEGSGKVVVSIYKKILLPNAFTPNDDIRNNIFRIPPGTTFQLQRFSVFNRWGEMIFTTNDISKGWNGLYKNILQPMGVYVYSISGLDQNKKVEVKGTVLLIR